MAPETRALAEHRAVLHLAPGSDRGAAVDHDAGADLDVVRDLHVVAEHQAGPQLGRMHAVLHAVTLSASRCGTPPASRERCRASSTRTARIALAAPDTGWVPLATHSTKC